MTWNQLIRKWQRRILRDPGWDIRILPSPDIDYPASATTDAEQFLYRRATIAYRPDAPPNNAIACHEVLHVAVAALGWAGVWAGKALGTDGSAVVAKEWIIASEEQAVELLTRAFLKAYGEN